MTKCYAIGVQFPNEVQNMRAPIAKSKKILSNRWVFKIKRKQDGSIYKYKARLVVRGC